MSRKGLIPIKYTEHLWGRLFLHRFKPMSEPWWSRSARIYGPFFICWKRCRIEQRMDGGSFRLRLSEKQLMKFQRALKSLNCVSNFTNSSKYRNKMKKLQQLSKSEEQYQVRVILAINERSLHGINTLSWIYHQSPLYLVSCKNLFLNQFKL